LKWVFVVEKKSLEPEKLLCVWFGGGNMFGEGLCLRGREKRQGTK